jgi:uncharacterized protein (TIGR03382 family)
MNIDAIQRSNGGATFGEGSFGSTLRVGFMEQGLTGEFSQQIFTVSIIPNPSPVAMALLGLAGLAGARRRR